MRAEAVAVSADDDLPDLQVILPCRTRQSHVDQIHPGSSRGLEEAEQTTNDKRQTSAVRIYTRGGMTLPRSSKSMNDYLMQVRELGNQHLNLPPNRKARYLRYLMAGILRESSSHLDVIIIHQNDTGQSMQAAIGSLFTLHFSLFTFPMDVLSFTESSCTLGRRNRWMVSLMCDGHVHPPSTIHHPPPFAAMVRMTWIRCDKIVELFSQFSQDEKYKCQGTMDGGVEEEMQVMRTNAVDG